MLFETEYFQKIYCRLELKIQLNEFAERFVLG